MYDSCLAGHRFYDIQLIRQPAPRSYPAQMLSLIEEHCRWASMPQCLLNRVLQLKTRSRGRRELSFSVSFATQLVFDQRLIHLPQHSGEVVLPAKVAAQGGHCVDADKRNPATV